MQNFLSLLFSAFLAYAWLGAAGNFLSLGGLFLFGSGGIPLVTSVSWKLAAITAALVWFGVKSWNLLPRSKKLPLPEIEIPVFILAFALLLFTDFTQRRGAFHVDVVLLFEFAAAGFLLLYLWGRRKNHFDLKYLFRWPVLLVIQVGLTAVFLREADGRLLWSDDHPSFLYRLALLKKNFPDVVAYNTFWNGGYPTREIFPTGTIILFVLGLPFLPFIALDSLEHAARYTWLIPYFLVFILPWSIYGAARLLAVSPPGAVAAAILALAPSMTLFEFALKYGTLPFVVSAGLVPLAVACLVRLAFAEKPPSWRFALFSVVVFFLCLCWHLMAAAFVPMVLYLLRHVRQLRADRRLTTLFLAALATLLLLAPSKWSIVSDSPIPAMLSGGALPGSKKDGVAVPHTADKKRTHERTEQPPTNFGKLSVGRQNFSRLAGKANPFLLALALPACLLLPRGPKRFAIGGTALWALAIAIVGQQIKPQLELHRFVLVAEFLAAVACGHAIELLFLEQKKHWQRERLLARSSALTAAALALAIGGVFSAPLTAEKVYRNETEQSFVFAPPELPPFIEAMREHGGAGRVFFSGFVLHDFGAKHYNTQDGGHIAPLPLITGRPMYASHFSHAYWATVDPIPEEFRARDNAGIEEFLDLVNVTSMVTFKREWTRYCKKDPRYARVWDHGRFHLFTRTPGPGGWFRRGSGELEISDSTLSIVPTSEEIVLKFRWFPRLKIDRSDVAELSGEPVFIDDMVRAKDKQAYFIRLKVRPEALEERPRITISY